MEACSVTDVFERGYRHSSPVKGHSGRRKLPTVIGTLNDCQATFQLFIESDTAARDHNCLPPRVRMNTAGLPPWISPGGTSCRTTLPATKTEESPIVTPGQITHCAPTQTRSCTVTG